MKDKSALSILPTFRRQINDTNRIFTVSAIAMLRCNIILFHKSHSVMTVAVTVMALTVGILTIVAYCLFFKKLLRNGNASCYYLYTVIEYVLLFLAYTPLFLYLFVEQHWNMLDRFGTDCLFLYNRYINWLLPISSFAMISVTYWIIMCLAYKGSTMFYLLEKRKKEIYE